MKIHQGESPIKPEHFNKPNRAVVTSGTFDGVHIGHQKILNRVIELARETDGESVVLTYWPHPRMVLKPGNHGLKLLSTFNEKAALLESAGIDHLIRIPFTEDFSRLTSEEFVRRILINSLGTRYLVIGYDHRFGKNREGGLEHLQQNQEAYGFEVEEIPRQDIDDIGVSSTKIRNALENGDIETANSYLNRSYSLTGKVVKGQQNGRNIGFPTANVHIAEDYKLIPADGAYAAWAVVNGKPHGAMMNIGVRPTVGDGKRTVETHIFGFSENLYGEEVTLQLVAPLRPEMKFNSLEHLASQLTEDKEKARALLGLT
jgi:riboflavin kinase / FMN adenylyltransferase